MTNVRAIIIAKNIKAQNCSRAEKLAAIVKIRDMPTLNSINKDELMEIIRFLLNELVILQQEEVQQE